MKRKTENLKVLESTRVDFSLFHDVIMEEFEAHAYLSPCLMTTNDIVNVTDSVVALLVKHTPFCLTANYGCTRAVQYFFPEGEFLDIFDDLRIRFSDFLSDFGIDFREKYVVRRTDTYYATFFRVSDDDYKTLSARLNSLAYSLAPVFAGLSFTSEDSEEIH